MSLRNQGTTGTDVMYRPRHAVETLIDHAEEIALFDKACEIWECAAGAGHIAAILHAHGFRVLATDIKPPRRQVHPVTQLDFLSSIAPSGRRLQIATNTPYGHQSRLAIAFLNHAFKLLERRIGSIALLLPFEFDATGSRNELVGAHPWFVGKRTCKRIRWLNLPQKRNDPMGHHAWYMWSNDIAVQRRARTRPLMVAA